MTNKKEEARFEELMENLSNREWQTREELLSVEDMSQAHIERVIRMIEDGELHLYGLEQDYLDMFKEELSDRADELNFD